MVYLLNVLSFIINVYMMIIFFRIILTWFSGMGHSGLENFLAGITDPYLNWFRRFTFLRLGYLDLSPIVALGILSLVNRIIGMLAVYGKITLGVILAMALQAVWAAVSFILGFLIIVLLLGLIANLLKQSGYNPFWRVVFTISEPVVYRINRVLFKGRILNFMAAQIIPIVCLVLVYLVLRIIVVIVSGFLAGLPV
jgi:YggT family protein